MECVKKCEFQEFDGNDFYCKLYDQDLNLDIVSEDGTIRVIRCKECKDEKYIGSNTTEESVRKLKTHLGWLMDSFYSLKDDMEEEVTNLYRIVKEMQGEIDDG